MKFVCTVCGWSTEADKAPERCPLCGATTFKEVGGGEKTYACEHKVGDKPCPNVARHRVPKNGNAGHSWFCQEHAPKK